jgi:hypothetical protein
MKYKKHSAQSVGASVKEEETKIAVLLGKIGGNP